MNQNQQKPEALESNRDFIDVHSIFYTIQGEGPFAGTPAVFVRLAGCNLQCPLCDTDYTSERKRFSIDGFVHEVIEELPGSAELIVITGGEPFRQMSIIHGAEELIDKGLVVQFETNGVLYPAVARYLDPRMHVVISPKTSRVHKSWLQTQNAIRPENFHWKYVLHADLVDLEDGLPLSALGMNQKPQRPPGHIHPSRIYIQPLDVGDEEENARHRMAAVTSCMMHGYRLNLQVHKLLGLP